MIWHLLYILLLLACVVFDVWAVGYYLSRYRNIMALVALVLAVWTAYTLWGVVL